MLAMLRWGTQMQPPQFTQPAVMPDASDGVRTSPHCHWSLVAKLHLCEYVAVTFTTYTSTILNNMMLVVCITGSVRPQLE